MVSAAALYYCGPVSETPTRKHSSAWERPKTFVGLDKDLVFPQSRDTMCIPIVIWGWGP